MAERGERHHLPQHVARYLEDLKVEAGDLPPEVLEVLAGLTTGEVALIGLVGSTLRDAGVDRDIIFMVH
jgi:hypothetical protein